MTFENEEGINRALRLADFAADNDEYEDLTLWLDKFTIDI